MSVVAPDAEDIQRQMRSVRSHLSADVNELVENARDMADWRYYVRRYPWASVTAAAAVGFLLVPAATPGPKPASPEPSTAEGIPPLAARPQGGAAPWSQWISQFGGELGGMAASAISRAAIAYASQQLTRLLDDVKEAAAHPSPPGGTEYEEPHF